MTGLPDEARGAVNPPGPDGPRDRPADRAPAASPGKPCADLRFSCRPCKSPFASICNALPLVAIVGLYFPYASSMSRALLVIALAVALGTSLILWLVFRGSRHREVTLSEEGIRRGRRSARWEEITAVRWGWPRVLPVAVVLGRREPKAWARRLRLPAPRLRLPPWPVVFVEVLPAVARRCPDATWSPRVARGMRDPGWAASQPRWPAIALLILAGALLSVPVLEGWATLGWPLYLLVLAPTFVVMLVAWTPAVEPEHRFVVAVAASLGAMPLAALTAFWDDVPLFALDAVMALCGVLCLAAAAVLGLRWKLRAGAKAAVLICAIVAAGAVYAHGARQVWPPTDITPLLAEGRQLLPLPFIWSREGNLAVELTADPKRGERQHMVDLSSRTARTLPGHTHHQVTFGVSRWCVARMAMDANGWALYAYRVEDGREARLSARPWVRVSVGTCLSPDGRRVCWLDADGDDAPAALHVYDVRADANQTVPVAWPEDDNVSWTSCAWLGDAELGVRGHRRPDDPNDCWEPRDLHLLRVGLDGRVAERLSCAVRFREWRISPDCRRAFAAGRQDAREWTVSYVDPAADRITDLGGGELPFWEVDGRHAWRVARIGDEGRWLCRFDPDNTTWTRKLQLPEGCNLLAFSPRGRTAILRWDRRLRPLEAVDLATGRRHVLEVSLLSSLPTAAVGFGGEHFPWVSIFSADGRRFIVQSMSLPEQAARVNLYELPEDWMAEEDRAKAAR